MTLYPTSKFIVFHNKSDTNCDGMSSLSVTLYPTSQFIVFHGKTDTIVMAYYARCLYVLYMGQAQSWLLLQPRTGGDIWYEIYRHSRCHFKLIFEGSLEIHEAHDVKRAFFSYSLSPPLNPTETLVQNSKWGSFGFTTPIINSIFQRGWKDSPATDWRR